MSRVGAGLVVLIEEYWVMYFLKMGSRCKQVYPQARRHW